ncbi:MULTISPECIES: hypothetical protein [unclassified Moorena]|uniref:hypothetical protein n=1 Tax=unclassified Moorena TaxID=2683338 RepID=UPI0013C7E030|nr:MULTISPECIES: hypothetical protein [unclassified Moorena]NEO22253.1 hypothetical protein [Moorena sp. SIO4A5]NEQ57747.1 hypothetical protein [Moorena sp. SIO4A1]
MQEELNEIKSRVKALEEKVYHKADQVEAEEKPKFQCYVDTKKIDVKEHNICYDILKELGYNDLIVKDDGCIGPPGQYLYKVIDNDEKKVHECFSLEGIKDFIKKQSKKA